MNYTRNVSKNINNNNNININLPSYLHRLDMEKLNSIINNNIPDSFYIDHLILSKYCWHCQNCNTKHIYLNCSFIQSIELTLYYECNGCHKRQPVRDMKIH